MVCWKCCPRGKPTAILANSSLQCNELLATRSFESMPPITGIFHTSLRLAFGSHSCAPQPNHNFHQVQAGSIHGACVSCEEAARKYLRRAYRSTLRPVITMCVREMRKDIHIPVIMAEFMTAASCLCFYCSSSSLCGRQIGSARYQL